jgi:D-cysteine desulfhydrase
VEGIHNDKTGGLLAKIQTLAGETAARLKLDLSFSKDDFILHESYGALGYGVVTDVHRDAIRLLARTEGIVTDPVYTGHALAGLIDLLRQGVYGKDETILYWHTGGTAGLFSSAAKMLD